MAEAAGNLLLTPVHMRPSMETVLAKLIETESRHRDDKKTARLLKRAKLFCKPLIARTGCGKTFLACAIGHQACRLGMKVLYLGMNHFVHQLKSATTQGITEGGLEKLNKNDLIILDDFALRPIDENTRLALLTLLDDRYEKKSVIITSQLPYDKWYEYIGQTTVADAILDRIQHSSHLIRLEGHR